MPDAALSTLGPSVPGSLATMLLANQTTAMPVLGPFILRAPGILADAGGRVGDFLVRKSRNQDVISVRIFAKTDDDAEYSHHRVKGKSPDFVVNKERIVAKSLQGLVSPRLGLHVLCARTKTCRQT